MNFIAVINKYSRDTKYTKTKLYHYCEVHKKELESMDIRFKIKSEIDLFNSFIKAETPLIPYPQVRL